MLPLAAAAGVALSTMPDMDDDTGFRAFCLGLPGAFEDHPFGPDSTVFKVAGSPEGRVKMFALLWKGSDPARANLKCEPTLAD